MNSCKNTSKKASNIHNFKGIYFNNEPEEKMLDLSTGAHFKYIDMYHRLQVVVDIRKSEERAKQSPLPICSTVDKRSRSIEDSFDYSCIKQKSLLSRLPVQINSQISHNHKTNNPHSDKLNNIMEAQSRRQKFCRNLDKQSIPNKLNQSLEDRRESIAFNKILAKLGKNNGSVNALKQRIKDNTNLYGSKNYNRKQLRRDIINQMHRRASSSNNNYKNEIKNPINEKIHFRNRHLKIFKNTQNFSAIKESCESLNRQSISKVQSRKLLKLKNKNKYVINQEGSIMIRDYNAVKLEKNSSSSSKNLINILNEK